MSKKKSAACVVYCGPTLPGIARRFSIYTNGIPVALEAKAAEIPAISALILPLDELPAARTQLNAGAGLLYSIYTEAQRIIKTGGI